MIKVSNITRDYESLISIFLFGGAVAAYYSADGFAEEAAIFPRMVTVLAIFLTAIMVFKAAMRTGEDQEPDAFFIHVSRFAIASGVMFLYLLSINYVGYFTSTVVFIPCLAYLMSYKNVTASITLTVGFVTAIYVIFVGIFKTTLPPEILLQLMFQS